MPLTHFFFHLLLFLILHFLLFCTLSTHLSDGLLCCARSTWYQTKSLQCNCILRSSSFRQFASNPVDWTPFPSFHSTQRPWTGQSTVVFRNKKSGKYCIYRYCLIENRSFYFRYDKNWRVLVVTSTNLIRPGNFLIFNWENCPFRSWFTHIFISQQEISDAFQELIQVYRHDSAANEQSVVIILCNKTELINFFNFKF